MVTIVEGLKDVELRGFKEYNLSKLCFFMSELDRVQHLSKDMTFLTTIKKCISTSERWVYNSGNSNILFFLNHTRSNNVDLLNSVSDLIPRKCQISYLDESRIVLNRCTKNIWLIFSWLLKLRATKLMSTQKYFLIRELLRIKYLDDFLSKSVDISKFRLVVAFYDAQTFGNFLIQKAQLNRILTATLSHGIVLAQRSDMPIDYCGIELRGTISDFFLGWNKFSKNEALKQGISENKIKILGVPYFIGYDTGINNYSGGRFGLVLDNMSGDIFNKRLIVIGNQLSKELNIKYTIRFHPSFNGNEYDKIIDFNYYEGINTDSTIKEYVRTVDFTLLANSSVFIELIYLKHKVYRYGDNSTFDKYRAFKQNSFSSYATLSVMYKSNENRIDELFEELCTVSDVKKSFTEFFKQFELISNYPG